MSVVCTPWLKYFTTNKKSTKGCVVTCPSINSSINVIVVVMLFCISSKTYNGLLNVGLTRLRGVANSLAIYLSRVGVAQ